jgi:DNA-binding PadR family transcriptional regulator
VPLVFAPGPNGKTLPLQRVRKVYTLAPDGEARAEQFREGVELYVSHWETCAKRDQIKREQAEARNNKET